MNYKIVNGKVGFPTNSLGKVTSKLDDCKVNYIVIVNDIEEDKKVFSRNNYIDKPNSLIAHYDLLIPTIEEAIKNNQIQPVLKEYKKELKK